MPPVGSGLGVAPGLAHILFTSIILPEAHAAKCFLQTINSRQSQDCNSNQMAALVDRSLGSLLNG